MQESVTHLEYCEEACFSLEAVELAGLFLLSPPSP